MGISKTELFTEEQNQLAKLSKALAHPARVAILDHLIKQNACINSDLVSELGLAQATISQHLKELKEMDLIKGNIEGTSMSYCIDKAKWQETREIFDRFFSGLESLTDKDCC